MKAAKAVVLVGLLAMAALVAILFVLLSDRNSLLITDATAAQLLGKPATVGVFLTIENSGGPDRLTAARSIVAQRARLGRCRWPTAQATRSRSRCDRTHIRLPIACVR